jgi:hypothetical protein
MTALPFRVGDTVTTSSALNPPHDGTVVDVIDDHSSPPVVRVYWRYPLGKVSDHMTTELVRIT